MCTRHTANLMTSKATSSYLESRLTPGFNNGLRQLLLLQGKSASNLLFQGRQEHRSNVEATTSREYFKRALAIPLLDHLATQRDILSSLLCLVPKLLLSRQHDQLKDALRFYRLRSPTLNFSVGPKIAPA